MGRSRGFGSRPSGFARTLRILVSLVAVALLLIAAAWWLARPPVPDGFYELPAQPSTEPGTLLRSEPFTRDLPADARAWRILYATTRADGSFALASAIVVAPSQPASSPRPVIAWAHGTTGVARGCAPSLLPHPFANLPGLERILAEGWVYVATDYVGLGTGGGHAYLIGEEAAHAVLDAVRAARRLPALNLDERVVVWGHSQGGNSALWVGMRAADYAPELKLMGTAALAPASDLPALIASRKSTAIGKIVSAYLARAYSRAYPDVAAASPLRFRAFPWAGDIAGRCMSRWASLVSMLETGLLPRNGIFAADPAGGVLGARLLQNTPQGPMPAPVLIAQGDADDLVPPDIQKRYVDARCAGGQPIDYRLYRERDHFSLVAADAPLTSDLIAWTRARLAGEPASPNCGQP